MADLNDLPLVETARSEAQGLIQTDPDMELAPHRALATELRRFSTTGGAEIS